MPKKNKILSRFLSTSLPDLDPPEAEVDGASGRENRQNENNQILFAKMQNWLSSENISTSYTDSDLIRDSQDPDPNLSQELDLFSELDQNNCKK